MSPSRTATTEEEVAEPAGPPPERYWWLWLVLLLLVVVAGLIIWWLLTRGNDKSTVPNVLGLRAPAAVQRISDKHLKPATVQGQSQRPPGIVFAQRPGAGTRLKHGQTVVISVSSGRKAVPDVTSLPVAQAKQNLSSDGFNSTVVRRASTRPKGVVTAQSPAAGVTAATGTTVTLTVSSGVKPVVVPQVVGQTQGSAVNALTGAGLKPVLHNVPSTKPSGIVVAQKPKATTQVDKGSKVTLNVSTGSAAGPTTTTLTTTTTATRTATTTTSARSTAPVRVSHVVGLAQTPALRTLNTQGLRPTVVYKSSSQPANRVLTQSPTAGTSLRRGSRVHLVVSSGPNPQPATSVPNVVGEDQATAARDLRSAGFKVVVLNRPTTTQSNDGMVVDEQPHGGSSIPAGSQVTIFVGRFSG